MKTLLGFLRDLHLISKLMWRSLLILQFWLFSIHGHGTSLHRFESSFLCIFVRFIPRCHLVFVAFVSNIFKITSYNSFCWYIEMLLIFYVDLNLISPNNTSKKTFFIFLYRQSIQLQIMPLYFFPSLVSFLFHVLLWCPGPLVQYWIE